MPAPGIWRGSADSSRVDTAVSPGRATYGGRGLNLVHQLIWLEEYANAGGPDIGCAFVGINHGGPTLIARGSEPQKQRHLPRILAGEEVWCQGFSEPGAGSDLASIATSASLEDDQFVVNGQKIWTSYAHMADYQELLVRTDPCSSRHHGLTWLICDMRAPGITVRPIISMDGFAEFCEVFYDDVRIPADNVVGEVGRGLDGGDVDARIRARNRLHEATD